MSITTEKNITLKPRQKLTYKEQIEDLKTKGVTFTIMNEDLAEDFLTNNNYYFKLKAYAKNYITQNIGPNEGKYCNLDFAYLVELSTLDMYLRNIIFKFCLDIEHYLKLQLVRDCTNNPDDNGYDIISDLFLRYPDLEGAANNVKDSSYCSGLFSTYSNHYALWNLIEVLQFGDFSKLYSFYYDKYPHLSGARLAQYIFNVRCLRNAAAHNNCIINDLNTNNNFKYNKSVYSSISKIPKISLNTLSRNMTNQRVHDFVAMLFVFDKVVTSPNRKIRMFGELNDFFSNRLIENKHYFISNGMLQSRYQFVYKVIQYYCKKTQEESQR